MKNKLGGESADEEGIRRGIEMTLKVIPEERNHCETEDPGGLDATTTSSLTHQMLGV